MIFINHSIQNLYTQIYNRFKALNPKKTKISRIYSLSLGSQYNDKARNSLIELL